MYIHMYICIYIYVCMYTIIQTYAYVISIFPQNPQSNAGVRVTGVPYGDGLRLGPFHRGHAAAVSCQR